MRKTLKKLWLAALAIALCLCLGLTVLAQGSPPDATGEAAPDSIAADTENHPDADTPALEPEAEAPDASAPEESPSLANTPGVEAGPAPEAGDTPPEPDTEPPAPAESTPPEAASGPEADANGETETPPLAPEESTPSADSSASESHPTPDEETTDSSVPQDTPLPEETPPPEESSDSTGDASAPADETPPEGEDTADLPEETEGPTADEINAEDEKPDDSRKPDKDNKAQPYGLALDDTRIVVYTYGELKTALSEDNGYTTVYLGANITGESGGIIIAAGKRDVVIDGSPPDGGRYTFTQALFGNATSTIRVADAAIQSVTLRNMDIVGNNSHGVVYAPDNAGVLLIHENVHYTGPQAVYNRSGTTRLINSHYTLAAVSGIAAAELAETLHLELGGNVTITAANTLNAILWLQSGASTFTVLAGANVTVDTNYYFLYTGGTVPDVRLEANASFSLTSRRFGFTYADQRVGHFTLASGAHLSINLATTESYAALRVAKLFQMDPGSSATLRRTGTAGIALRLTNANAQAVFNQPQRVFFYSTAGVPLRFTGNGTLSITTSALNLWKQTGWPLAAGTGNLPGHIWNKAGNALLTLAGTYYETANRSLSSNLSASDPHPTALTTDNFDLEHSQLLAFGSMALDIDALGDQADSITGGTWAGAGLLAGYTLADGQLGSSTATADGNGRYQLPVSGALQPGSTLRVTAVAGNLAMTQTATVQDSAQHKLAFLSVPPVLTFGSLPVPEQQTLVERQDAGFTLTVADTRLSPSPWRIDASLAQPLGAPAGGQLPNAVVFKADGGTPLPLGEVPTTVYRHTDGATGTFEVQWADTDGILLSLAPGEIYSDTDYTATIHWALVDAP